MTSMLPHEYSCLKPIFVVLLVSERLPLVMAEQDIVHLVKGSDGYYGQSPHRMPLSSSRYLEKPVALLMAGDCMAEWLEAPGGLGWPTVS